MRWKGFVVIVSLAVAAIFYVATGGGPGSDRPALPGRDPAPVVAPPSPGVEFAAVEAKPGLRWMSSFVFDSETISPIEGAELAFEWAEEKSRVVSDDRGEWRCLLPRRVTHFVFARVTAEGYLPEHLFMLESSSRRLDPALEPVFLEPTGAVLFGRVLGPDERPVTGARVRAWWDTVWLPVDEDGRFGPLPVQTGERRVTVLTSVGACWAQAVRVPRGHRGRFDVTIRLPAARFANGLVVDEADRPVAGAVVRSSMRDAGTGVRTGPDGRFRWPLLVPEDEIRAEKEGYVCPGGPRKVSFGGEARIVLEPAASLEGRVQRADGSPPPPGLRIWCSGPACPLGPNGEFRLDPIPASIRVLEIEYPVPFRTEPWEWERVVTRVDHGLAIGEHRTGYVITLPPLVPITGTVVDARTRKPVAGAWVEHVRTDDAGRFEILLGSEKSESDGINLDIEADGYLPVATVYRQGLVVALRPARLIEVTVLDERGEALPAVIVRVSGAETFPGVVSGVTDLDGRCRVRAPMGEAGISCTPHRGDVATAVVPEGQDSITMRIGPPSVRYTLQVEDENGRPLPDAWVECEGRRTHADSTGRIELFEGAGETFVGAPGRETTRTKLIEDEEGETLRYRLEPAAPVRARFLHADGAPITALPVEVLWHKGWTDAEGRVVFDDCANGILFPLDFEVEGWEFEKVWAKAGGEEVLVRLPARGEIVIRYAADAARGDEPVTLVFRPGDPHDQLPSFRKRSRGELRMSLQEETVSLCVHITPGVFRFYPDLVVRKGRPVVVDYDFPRHGRVTGLVTGPMDGGTPLDSARIEVWDLGRERLGSSEKGGRFTLPLRANESGHAVGPVRLFVHHQHHAPLLVGPVDFSRDQELQIRLTKGGRLTGHVLGLPGRGWMRFLEYPVIERNYARIHEGGFFSFDGRILAGRHRVRILTEDGVDVVREVLIEDGKDTEVTLRVD